MLGLFNTWGLILDTLMQLKERQKDMQAYFLLDKAQDQEFLPWEYIQTKIMWFSDWK